MKQTNVQDTSISWPYAHRARTWWYRGHNLLINLFLVGMVLLLTKVIILNWLFLRKFVFDVYKFCFIFELRLILLILKNFSLISAHQAVYGCETGTLFADCEKRFEALGTKCPRKLFRISYLKHKINDWVRGKINSLVSSQVPLLATVKRRILARFGHITRNDSLFKAILHSTLESVVGQTKWWMGNIK